MDGNQLLLYRQERSGDYPYQYAAAIGTRDLEGGQVLPLTWGGLDADTSLCVCCLMEHWNPMTLAKNFVQTYQITCKYSKPLNTQESITRFQTNCNAP